MCSSGPSCTEWFYVGKVGVREGTTRLPNLSFNTKGYGKNNESLIVFMINYDNRLNRKLSQEELNITFQYLCH